MGIKQMDQEWEMKERSKWGRDGVMLAIDWSKLWSPLWKDWFAVKMELEKNQENFGGGELLWMNKRESTNERKEEARANSCKQK